MITKKLQSLSHVMKVTLSNSRSFVSRGLITPIKTHSTIGFTKLQLLVEEKQTLQDVAKGMGSLKLFKNDVAEQIPQNTLEMQIFGGSKELEILRILW